MGALLSTASTGQSEVLETLHYQGALSSGLPIYRLGPMVSHRWMGDEDREGSDAGWEADLITVLGALQTAGYVTGHDDLGNVVNLTAAPPSTTYVKLTAAGRVAGRAPRPRPRRIIG
jgi:hypothetical protein